MNKSQLVEYVADRQKTSKARAALMVESVFDGIRAGLSSDQTVTITGFGTFEVKPRKARIGRNPHTGEPIQIEAGRRVGFRVGKGLRNSV